MALSAENQEAMNRLGTQMSELFSKDPYAAAQVQRISHVSIGFLIEFFKDNGILTRSSSPADVLAAVTTAVIYSTDSAMDDIRGFLGSKEEPADPVPDNLVEVH